MSLTLATFAAAYLPDLASGLTGNLLGTSARSLRKRLGTPQRERALERCSGAAIAALVAAAEVEDEDQAKLLEDVFERFFKDEELGPEVAREVSVLLQGERLHRQSMAELFEEAGFDAKTLPGLDLGEALSAFESAFLLTATQEEVLQGEILLHETAKQTVLQQKILDRLPAPPPPASTEDLRSNYLEDLITRCRYLPLGSLGDKFGLETRVSLDQVFIEQYVEGGETGGSQPNVEAEPQRMLAGREDKRETAEAVAARCPKLVLTALGGGGKSSFAKELLARQAEILLGRREGEAGDLLPVLIELRRLGPRMRKIRQKHRGSELLMRLSEAILDHASKALEDRRTEGFAKELRAALEEGRCLMVLDGLDEVAPDLRATAKQAVEQAVSRFGFARTLVTSRTLSYLGYEPLDGFEHYSLAPLNRKQIGAFAEAWYGAQAANLGATKAELWGRELAQAATHQDLRELASNPMLLTAMALVHQEQHKLPKERACLYYRAVDVLAYRWQDHKEGDEAVPAGLLAKLGEDRLRWRILEHLGYSAHCSRERSGRNDHGGDLDETTLVQELKQPSFLGSADLADSFLNYIDHKAGLLVGEGAAEGQPRSFRFAHQTFQEYLAGRYLAGRGKPLEELRRHVERSDFWNLPTRMGTEDLLHERKAEEQFLLIAQGLSPSRARPSNAFLRSVLLSGAMAGEFGLERLQAEGGETASYLHKLRKRLRKMTTSSLTPVERMEAGRLLGQLGEPDDSLTSIAQLELCWVPPGEFFFSGAAKSEEEEGGYVSLDYGYWMGRFPVTNGQFESFVDAEGYREERYWPEAKEAGVWKRGKVEGWKDKEGRGRPFPYGEPFGFENHPVVGITWYEMLAYCRWLTEEARRKEWIPATSGFCLPSEMEWEMAARGGAKIPKRSEPVVLQSKPREPEVQLVKNREPERSYPWEGEVTEDRGSFGGFGATSRPGIFPGGRSPVGCEEMAGNVWEWTRSLGDKGRRGERRSVEEMRLELAAGQDEWRYLCGGAYYGDSNSVGCSARFGFNPDVRYGNIGFRVVLLPFTLDSGDSEL